MVAYDSTDLSRKDLARMKQTTVYVYNSYVTFSTYFYYNLGEH